MTASVDDQKVRSIRPSSYIDIGVEVDLGDHAITPGGRGTFRFDCVMPEMVFADTSDRDYASIQIRPTWFDPSLQVGTTQLRVAIHVPPGVQAAELRFQDAGQRYSDLVDNWGEGDTAHAVAIWQSPQHQLSAGNPKFGLSFPRRVMQRVVSKTPVQLLVEWFAARPQLQLGSGLVLLVFWAFTFFRFSHGTGFVVFLFLAGIMGAVMAPSPGLHLLAWPGILSLLGLNEWYLRRRKLKRKYLPAMATVEGGGIKRGLTAPQAAVLLESPLPKVLAMVVFGLLKKGILELVSDPPLTVKVKHDFMTTRDKRLQVAARLGTMIHDYEHGFLDRLMQHEGPVEDCKLNEPIGELVRSVTQRMQGFDLDATREYYRRIVQRAFKECQSIGEIQQRDEAVERNFEWMMMDPDWTEVLDDWHRRGYDYRPRWTRIPREARLPQAMPAPGTGGPGKSGGTGSSPTFGDVAGSFAGWAESTAGRFASMIEPSAMGLDIPKAAGVLDLSGVDRITGDVFKAMAEAAAKGGSGGGRSGGGCACACAGCACACACAGGGR
jgi:hypothetical protein